MTYLCFYIRLTHNPCHIIPFSVPIPTKIGKELYHTIFLPFRSLLFTIKPHINIKYKKLWCVYPSVDSVFCVPSNKCFPHYIPFLSRIYFAYNISQNSITFNRGLRIRIFRKKDLFNKIPTSYTHNSCHDFLYIFFSFAEMFKQWVFYRQNSYSTKAQLWSVYQHSYIYNLITIHGISYDIKL